MLNDDIQEVLSITQQAFDELRQLVTRLSSKTEIIKEFLTAEIVRTSYTPEVKALLLDELNKCQDTVPTWIIDEIYRTPEVVVTLTKSSKSNNESDENEESKAD